MRKKQRLSIYDLGRIPVTPVHREESVGTLKQFRESEDRKAREAAATRQAEIERVQKNTSRLMAECLSTSAPQMTKFWSQPLDKIKPRIHDDSVFDNLFLPTSEEKADSNVIYDAIQAFLDDDVFTRGYSLGNISRRRFGLFVASQVNAGVIVDKASLAVMFRRAFELGIFKDDSGTEFNDSIRVKKVVEQPRVEEPVDEAPIEPTYADLEACDVESRDGRREAHRIADRLYNLETNALAAQWAESLRVNFGLILNQEQIKAVHQWFDANPTQSWVSHRSYDLCRLALVRNRIFPPTATTAVERFARELESLDLTRMSFEDRQNLKRRQAAAEQEDRLRFGGI